MIQPSRRGRNSSSRATESALSGGYGHTVTELETIHLCLDNLESASKLLELGVISSEESEAVIHVSKTWLDAAIAPFAKKVKEPP